jgi:hypothetical protein
VGGNLKRKIFVLIVTLLISISGFVIVFNDFEVKATGGGGGGGGKEDDDIGLDYNWMWDDVIQTICNATYEAYEGDKIIRGREMGTKGDRWTAVKIENFMANNCSLENVKQLKLGPIEDDWRCWGRYYTSRMNVTDYLLHIKIDSENYDKDIPVNESYVIPMVRPIDPLLSSSLDFNFTLPDEDDIVIELHPDGDWPAGGSLTNYTAHKNLSIDPTINEFDILIGNATYIESGDLPDDQENRVFLFDEETGVQDMLDNVTNATGVLLIHNHIEESNEITKEIAANYSYSICRVETSEGNLTQILNGLDNESMIVDNIIDNNTLTFTYNLSQACVPDPDYVFLNNIDGWSGRDFGQYLLNLLNQYIIYVLNLIRIDLDLSLCKGCIAYQTNENCDQQNLSHVMNQAVIGNGYNAWFRFDPKERDSETRDGKYWRCAVLGGPSLPIFYVNYSIGNMLYENCSEALISGYEDQEFLEEKHSPNWTLGVDAYNVVGELTKDQSGTPDPDDPTVIISNRYDGWWSEAAFDSGCGVGVVLAIAKYFKDNEITPKVNVVFLETTGEEYMFRGAQHYSDSHPDRNFAYWIGFDQLASNWTDAVLEITYNDNEIRNIGDNISKEMGYPKRTTNGYEDDHYVTDEFTGAEGDVWKERHKGLQYGGINCPYQCKTICFARQSDNRIRHRRGEMIDGRFTAGDILANIDREDLNDTLELAWNITKYFTVNPDSWFNEDGWNYTISDSEDNCSYNDTVFVEFDVKSTLPHDKVMINITLGTFGEQECEPVMSKDINSTVNRTWKTLNVSFTLPANESPGHYKLKFKMYNSTGCIDEIIQPGESKNINVIKVSDDPFFLYPYDYCGNPPAISNVNILPSTVGYGFNVTISTDVSSSVGSNIDIVTANISYPDSTIKSFNMSNTVNDTYEFMFNDTWQYGEYEFVIWTKDENGNVSGSPEYNFSVYANVTISICTIKDSYGDGEIVNLTDPPGPPLKPTIGYEFLDDNQVLHIWNRYDSYYFSTSNGVQFTNHKDDYWSHNVLMLGYYDNEVWNLIYRTDNLSGFKKKVSSDNETYVNATLWKDLSYGGYDFRLAIRYYLGVDDNELTVIPYIKNLDDESIPYVLGFGWEIKDIQVDMTPEYDYIEIDGTSYFLNQSLDETYTNLVNPCYYIREDKMVNTFESLYLRWDEDLNYKVKVESREGQYNAPVTLGIKIGTLDVGQEKFTSLFWHDASEIIYYFDGYNTSIAWSSNPGYMVDGNESSYASTSMPGPNAVENCINNTCDGSYLGNISKVELRCKAYRSGEVVVGMNLTPIYNGNSPGSPNTYNTSSGPPGVWSQWFDITSGLPSAQWNWYNVKNLDCDVLAPDMRESFTLYCSKVDVRVTYTPKVPSGISNPYPPDGSTGISIAPTLSITVADADNDTMNITWYSNSSGSWQVFGTNNSVGNGTYQQVFSNASVNGQWWYWNVSVDDGEVVNSSDIFSFYTGYESKIHNIGSTDISGYLTIKVDFYNETSELWEGELIVIDESYVVINSSEKLGLDTLFNPENVNTSSFTHGNGTYRVYTMLTDPNKNILFGGNPISSEDDIEAWYEFTVTYD